MKIIVDKGSSVSVHDQIYTEIENRIVSGILKAETKLPSLRKMCSETGVSHMTMVKVYEALEESGLVEKIHGKGTFVKSQYRNINPVQAEQLLHVDHAISDNDENEMHAWQYGLQDYVSAAGFRYNENLKHSNLGINLSLACLAPHLVPTKLAMDNFLSNETLKSRMNDLYPPIEGLPLMREAVVSVLSQRHIEAETDNTLITVGSQQAIRLIARTYIGPGDVVVVGAPTYPGVLDVFKNRGALIMEVPIDGQGMDTEALLSICENHDVKMVYVMPNFQNPTGAVMPLERKQDLLELADYHNFLIVEDDVSSLLAFDGGTLPLKALDKTGRVLYIYGFSKLYGHAFRLSAIVGAKVLLSKILSAKSSSDGGAPLINQLIMASFIDSDEQKHYLTDLISHLKGVRDEVYDALKTYLPDYVEVQKPKGGMLFWLTFPKEFNCNLLHYKAIERYRINFLPGEFCYNSKQGRNQMRICYTSAPTDVVIDAIMKLGTLVDEVYEISQMF